MSKSLVIVESPAKAKTINKYLGNDFSVEASLGHIKDLPKNRIGVDLEDGSFEPELIVIPGKEKIVERLKKLARGGGGRVSGSRSRSRRRSDRGPLAG